MNNKNILAALALSTSLLGTCIAHAEIQYQLIDLPDPVGAPDLMELVYHVDNAFLSGGGFNLIYSPAHYADLQVSVPLDANWFPSLTQPDAAAPLDGVLSYMALADSAAGPRTFTVTFTNIGGHPGAQAYELFDDSFNIVHAGTTIPTAAVPELPIAAFLVGGLPLIWLARRRLLRQAPPP
jgi:hypothetical protein